jgi:hypothetical protein
LQGISTVEVSILIHFAHALSLTILTRKNTDKQQG